MGSSTRMQHIINDPPAFLSHTKISKTNVLYRLKIAVIGVLCPGPSYFLVCKSNSKQTDKLLRESVATTDPSWMKPGIILSEKNCQFAFSDRGRRGVRIRAGITHGWGMLKPVCVWPAHSLNQHQFTTETKHWWQMVAYHWTGQEPSLAHWHESPSISSTNKTTKSKGETVLRVSDDS